MKTVHDRPSSDDEANGPTARSADAAVRSRAGTKHARNEDRAYVGEVFVAVADGMGGPPSGDVAAQIAVSAIRVADEHLDARAPLTDQLHAAVVAANHEIRVRAHDDPECTGMGTTLTALGVSSGQVLVAWVGDSPAILVRDGVGEKLVSEHSLVRHLVDIGELDARDARDHPRSNVITRALGPRARVRVDMTATDVRPGDRLLICSDGITGALDLTTIADVVSTAAGPAAACEQLLDRAVEAGAADDVTALVVDVTG